MDLEEYRKLIKKRTSFTGCFLAVYAVINMITHFSGFFDRYKDDFESGIMSGFQGGLLLGIAMLCVVRAFIYSKTVHNDDDLKKMYNREFDERAVFIRQKCGAGVILPLSVFIIAAAVVAGYFNFTVFITLLSTALFQMTCCAVLKIYYCRKF